MDLEEGRQHLVMQLARKSDAFIAPFLPDRLRGPAQRLVFRGNPLLSLGKPFGSNKPSPRQCKRNKAKKETPPTGSQVDGTYQWGDQPHRDVKNCAIGGS